MNIVDVEPGSLVKVPESLRASFPEEKEGVYVGGEYLNKVYHSIFRLRKSGERVQAVASEVELLQRKKFVHDISTFSAGVYYSGCDPEIFVFKGDGGVFPAREFLGDKKTSPRIFYDGIQAEFCPVAGGCLEQMWGRILAGLVDVQRAAKIKDPKAKLTIQNAIKLSKDQLKTLSDEDLAFRCSTSLNVYEDFGDLPDAREYPWRFAGGHIHVGCRTKAAPVIRAIVKALDGVLGVAGVSLASTLDCTERRRMYGRAGEFRLPKHGLEYRVLSNFWLCHPLIFHLVFEVMRLAFNLGEQGLFPVVWEGKEEEIRDIINWCDVDGARKMLKKNEGVLRSLLVKKGRWTDKQMDKMIETLLNGVGVVVDKPEDIEGNWNLGGMGNYPAYQWTHTKY